MIEIPALFAQTIVGWIVFLIVEGLMICTMIQGISTRNKEPAYNELLGWALFTAGLIMFIVVLFVALLITEEIVFV